MLQRHPYCNVPGSRDNRIYTNHFQCCFIIFWGQLVLVLFLMQLQHLPKDITSIMYWKCLDSWHFMKFYIHRLHIPSRESQRETKNCKVHTSTSRSKEPIGLGVGMNSGGQCGVHFFKRYSREIFKIMH